METLLTAIKQTRDIKGIVVENKEIKCITFADDLTNFLRNKESYDSLSSLLNTYGECSGLKLNKDKKEAYWLGSSYRNHEALDINKVNEPIKILGIFFTYDQRKSRELNFDLTLKSIRKSLSCWQWRNLTLIGKIQLVKTFAMLSLCIGPRSFISFDKDIIKSINSVIFNFVWRGKDKVKRLALISEYEDGGLKMPHPESLIKTQRIVCLARYLDDNSSPWKAFLSHYLKNVGTSFLLQCNFNPSRLPCKLPSFYKECLEILSDFNGNHDIIATKQDVLNVTIWNNQNLLINKKSICNKRIKEAGFVKLGDILSNDSKLKRWDAFREKNLSLSDYLLLQGIFSAIPPNWKQLLNVGENNNNRIDKTVSDDVQDITRMTSKSIYSTLVKRIQISPTAQSKFNSEYNISGNIDWKNIYLLPGRVTLDTRMRAFQYKILNRILYTNKILYKMNLVPSPMCTFCGDHEETLEHLLISCTYTKNFWLSVISWLNTYNMKIDKLDEVTILFGISDNNPGNCLLNHKIILGKYTIYSCRCKNIKPSVSLLKAKTSETRKFEFLIAKKNKKESIHYKKWENMLL